MRPVNVRDYESLARNALDRPIYDFIAGGAEDELSLVENVTAWSRIRLLPRVLADVTSVDTATELLGQRVTVPMLLAPVAYLCVADPEGEKAVARAAATAGTIMVLSTMSTTPMEEVSTAADGPRWFQLYVYPQREITQRLVQRAEAAGYSALCLTVDVPYLGRRERDLYNQLEFPPGTLPANFVDLIEVGEFKATDSALAAQAATMISPAITWAYVDWLRSITSMPVLLKGILAAEDAKIALEHGVAGIIVSNHGGRQLDGAPAPVEVLPDVVEAVAGRMPVLVDGGIRRGTEILKALALGADGVLIGRPYVWGLAAEGEAGVRNVIRMLQEEFRLAMALCGCRSVAEISRALVRV
jgi:isopentenyl diphosphate isomerase/L-lactate dehydrogenase-like FMN-dependent dehydrogenase